MTRTPLASLLTDETFGADRVRVANEHQIEKLAGLPELSKVSCIVRHGNCHKPLHKSWNRLYEVVFGRYSTMITRMQKKEQKHMCLG